MTGLFLKLLGAKVDDAVHIAKASLAFRGGLDAGWYMLLLIVIGTVVWWMYRRSPVNLSAARRCALVTLRIVFMGLVMMLLLRPVLALTVEGSVRRILVLMFDSSASMQIKDSRLIPEDLRRAAVAKRLLDPARGLSQSLDPKASREVERVGREDLVQSAFKNDQLNLLPRLGKEFDLAAFTFAQGVAEISARKADYAVTNAATKEKKEKVSVESFPWVDNLTATNPLTAIGDAIREVLNRKRGQPLAGVLLVTDGANNSGSQPREAAALARQENVPLYVYGVGITSPRDIIVGNLFAPDVTFVKDEVTVTVRVRGQGLSGQKAELVLNLGGQQVASEEVIFAAAGEQVVPLRFTPQAQGEFDLTAHIEPRPDETAKDNNTRTQRLKVIDAKIKVLLMDQSPRWDFRYLQAMLLRDRRVDLKCWLVEGDKALARGDTTPYLAEMPARKEELFKYDLVICGDVDPKAIGIANLENLNKLVSEFGGALVAVAGRKHMPVAYKRSWMERMLPVEFDTPALETPLDALAEKPIRLQLTTAGRSSAMLCLSDKDEENIGLWQQLPPVFWVAKVSRPKPAAEVLLVDPDPARESRFGKMPVIALQQYGLGQVMFVGTDNTWRWRKNVGDLYYTALWGQIAQRVSLPHLLGVSRRTRLSADRQNYTTGDRVSVYARLYSAGYDPLLEPSIKGHYGLKNGAGQRPEVPLRSLPEQPGLYRGEFVAPAAGAYQFWVEHDANTLLDFNVAEPKFELGETAMNEPLLREMAASTGGGFFREEDLHKLPEAISLKTERVRSPLEVELWSSPFFFLLMLGVVTAEWIVRKASYLK